MYRKLILYITVFCLILPAAGGCGVTRSSKRQEVERLRSRVAQLESEIEIRDKRQKETERLLEAETGKRRQMEEEIPSQRTKSYQADILAEKTDTRQSEQGSVSDWVGLVQLALKNAGFDPGLIDGKLGPNTRRAIIAFQKANNLVPDGIVGQKTWTKLKIYSKQ
jgi:hypothetical protein